MAADQSQRDLVLGEGQYAYIQDQTKGHVGIYTGPHKASLSQTDQPVRFNSKTSKFERCSLEDSTQEFVLAPEGSYIVLTNPAGDGKHPTSGPSNRTVLDHGRKVIVAGPASFALWPGQGAQVVEGHRLRSNQFLVAVVYNDEAAAANWKAGVLKPAQPGEQSKANVPSSFVMGQKLIIKGTEVSFFIPPTGIEVEATVDGRYVRDAVTLERLEYCLLLSEDGAKRYVVGPDVVFPEPTESFVEKDGLRKFRATELNDEMGIHVKVIADYEEGDRKFKTGEELFITGKEQRIYYPREEHAVVKYGDREKVFGVVIPKGEARYVLDKQSGKIGLVEGPQIFLPDPRKEVIVRRVLSEQQAEDYFPGNATAKVVNATLRAQTDEMQNYVASNTMMMASAGIYERGIDLDERRGAVRKLAADTFQRGQEYTPPRTITIDQRYDGAVQISPWVGFAVLVLGKSGQRRVVMHPQSVLLDFDETLQIMQLSTGKPKTTDNVLRTAYLLTANNAVSDIVRVVTKDMVEADIKLAYRVNFEAENDEDRLKWFSVQNYVKFLCDHARSRLRSVAKKVGIEELNTHVTQIVRDTILGTSDPGQKRPGMRFAENNMHVYDVEVLNLSIGDARIRDVLVQVQHTAVTQALQIGEAERALAIEQRKQRLEQERLQAVDATSAVRTQLAKVEAERKLMLAMDAIAARSAEFEERKKVDSAESAHRSAMNADEIARQQAQEALTRETHAGVLALELQKLAAEAEAYQKRFGAVSPQFIAALQSFGDSQLTVEATKALGVMSLLGGGSVADVLQRIFKGTKLEGVIDTIGKQLPAGNGAKA